MASTSTDRNRGNLRKAHYQQTVCLADWWLTESGNELAVAGFTSHEKQAVRVFSSAPIFKRYSVTNVETTDGICVILDGFINKDRTLENGFPSDVFNYFVFGFPPYWKEYYEKFMGKESSSKDMSADLLKKPSPCPGMVGGQTQVDCHETDFRSQGEMDAKGIGKRKTTKTLAFTLAAQGCGSEIGASEDNLNMPSITSVALQMESCSGGHSGDTIKSVSNSICEQRTIVPAVIENNVENSQINDSRGTLSACHLYKGRRKRATDNLENVESEKNNSMKANLDRGLSFSEDTSSSNDAGVWTRLMSSLLMKQKNNETSAGTSGTASVDRQPGSRNKLNFEVTGLNKPSGEIQLPFLDAGSDSYGFDQVPQTPKQDEDMGKIKLRSHVQKAKNKASNSLDSPAAADNQTDNTIAGTKWPSKKAKASPVETRRKLTDSEKKTSQSRKEKVPSASPQLSSCSRSRSGRLLMPTLEYWRNQIPVYDVSGTITGVKEGTPPSVSKIGTYQRNRRKRKQPA